MSIKQNSLSAHLTEFNKVGDFQAARARGEKAYYSNGDIVSLEVVGLHDVEFIGGLWRVQDKFPHKIQMVRDVPFVLGERIPRNERNLFEFYRARRVCENCYGKFLAPGPEKIVAKYTTDVYVTTLCVDYEKDEFKSFNGNIVYISNAQGYNVNCSNNNIILKESDWFKANRTWPTQNAG